jgi:FkbM family methyltransferase
MSPSPPGAALRHAVFTHLPRPLRRRHWIRHEVRTGERELRLVPSLLGSSGTFVDVGANTGIYSALALRHRRWVVAFEPVPQEAVRLRLLVGRRGTVHQVALSDRAGTATLYVPYAGDQVVTTRSSLVQDAHPDLAHRKLAVTAATLDSFDLAHVALIKVDVEGHELAVLRGAAQTLARCRPNLLVEVEEPRSAGALQAVSSFLSSLGYAGFWFDGRQLRPLSEFDPVHQQASQPRFGQARPAEYVNNFIWLPRNRALAHQLTGDAVPVGPSRRG